MNFARSRLFGLAAVAVASLAPLQAAHAQATTPFLGQIMCAGFNFAPPGWARMDGQLLPIAGLVAFYNEKVDLTVDGVAVARPTTKFS